MRSRKNKAILEAAGILTDRERLWQAMRRLQTFDARELSLATGVDRRKTVLEEYLSGLVRAGILDKTPPARVGGFARYALVRDTGVDAPRVRKNGSLVPCSGQSRMWQAMKILKVFSVRDLVVHAGLPDAPVTEKTAASYCRWLMQGQYLMPFSGEANDVLRYRFIRDTGAKAPQILRVKQLFDPNTGEVVTSDALAPALERAAGKDEL